MHYMYIALFRKTYHAYGWPDISVHFLQSSIPLHFSILSINIIVDKWASFAIAAVHEKYVFRWIYIAII